LCCEILITSQRVFSSMVNEKKSIMDSGIKFDRSNWGDVFSASLGKVMIQQIRCNDLIIKDRDWSADLSKGILSFGSDDFSVQFIGSESNSTGTWLWGWENVNNFPESILKVANEAGSIGDVKRLKQLTTAEIELTDVYNGYTFSAVACALSSDRMCYYRGPHGGGAIFMAFSPSSEEVFAPATAHEFGDTVMTCIQAFTVDHRIFIESFLDQNGTGFEWDRNAIIARFDNDLKIEFEPVGNTQRIKSISFVR